jgi:hypothetical protein
MILAGAESCAAGDFDRSGKQATCPKRSAPLAIIDFMNYDGWERVDGVAVIRH